VLLVAVGAAMWRLRADWIAARLREQALAHQTVKPPLPPPVIFGRAAEPVAAVSYADIVQKMLFSKDRNPTVVVAVVPPPTPKPMPALPLLYGVMNLIDGTTAIMSEKTGAKHRGVRTGEKVGEFTLVAITRDEITLAWDGKEITKGIEEMIDRGGPASGPSDSARNTSGATQTPAQQQPITAPKADAAPGTDLGNGKRSCNPGDASPDGTQSGGFRKKLYPTPFGNACQWEPL
jgi:hypothetical protein